MKTTTIVTNWEDLEKVYNWHVKAGDEMTLRPTKGIGGELVVAIDWIHREEED